VTGYRTTMFVHLNHYIDHAPPPKSSQLLKLACVLSSYYLDMYFENKCWNTAQISPIWLKLTDIAQGNNIFLMITSLVKFLSKNL
jgi:hypothetical protein